MLKLGRDYWFLTWRRIIETIFAPPPLVLWLNGKLKEIVEKVMTRSSNGGRSRCRNHFQICSDATGLQTAASLAGHKVVLWSRKSEETKLVKWGKVKVGKSEETKLVKWGDVTFIFIRVQRSATKVISSLRILPPFAIWTLPHLLMQSYPGPWWSLEISGNI